MDIKIPILLVYKEEIILMFFFLSLSLNRAEMILFNYLHLLLIFIIVQVFFFFHMVFRLSYPTESILYRKLYLFSQRYNIFRILINTGIPFRVYRYYIYIYIYIYVCMYVCMYVYVCVFYNKYKSLP